MTADWAPPGPHDDARSSELTYVHIALSRQPTGGPAAGSPQRALFSPKLHQSMLKKAACIAALALMAACSSESVSDQSGKEAKDSATQEQPVAQESGVEVRRTKSRRTTSPHREQKPTFHSKREVKAWKSDQLRN